MGITRVIVFSFVFLLCLGWLSAEQSCIKNTRRRPNRCESNKQVCCEQKPVYYCVKRYRPRENGVRVVRYKLCTNKRRLRRCSCMAGCIVTEYGSEKEHFIPVKGTKLVGCYRFGCKAIYGYTYNLIIQCKYYIQGREGSCFSLSGKK